MAKVKRYDASFEDTGCGGACVKSLECPFPVCRYDDPAALRRLKALESADEIVRLRLRDRLSAAETALRLGVGVRTVHRVLARREA